MTKLLPLRGSAAGRLLASIALSLALTSSARAAPGPSPVTPELEAAATKDGRVVFYTSMDVQVAEPVGKAFEAKYPGIAVQVERYGAERILQRVEQEHAAGIHGADVVETSDIEHWLYWRQRGWLAAYLPEDVARWPMMARDADGFYAAPRATFSVVAYNTRLVKPADAPGSYADLLDTRWNGKLIKAHPAYSGNTMTATFILSRLLGWGYFKQLSGQHVFQVQSANDPPKKLALGERPVMVDGTEYVALLAKAQGAPLAIVYPREGSPLVVGGSGIMKDAPHPDAARLFISFLFSRECQQLLVDNGQLRSFHPDVAEPEGRVPLAQIKVLTANPLEMEKAIDEVKRIYAEYFGT